MKKNIFLIIFLGLFIVIFSECKDYNPEIYGNYKKYIINENQLIGVFGNKDASSPFIKDISFLLYDKKLNKKYFYKNVIDNSYEPYFENEKNSILVYGYSGGSGNYIYFSLFSDENGIPEKLLDDKKAYDIFTDFTAEFKDNYKAEFKFQNGKEYILDITDRKKLYTDNNVYDKSGNFIFRDKNLMKNGISKIDILNKNYYRLETGVSGFAHYDKLVNVYFYFHISEDKDVIIDLVEIGKIL